MPRTLKAHGWWQKHLPCPSRGTLQDERGRFAGRNGTLYGRLVAESNLEDLKTTVEKLMPELCRFRGIVVLMFGNEGVHQVGHFHVFYAEYRASMAIDGSIIVGGLPRAQLKLVRHWAEMHQAELAANWALCRDGNPPRPIDPLA